MFNVCPVTTINGKYRPVTIDGSCVTFPEIPQLYTATQEQAETVSEVLDRLGAVNNYPVSFLDTDAFVSSVSPVENLFCGGQAEWAVRVVKDKADSLFKYATMTVYLSRGRDGVLRVNIPA